jgi:lipoate-protein ligase B
MSRLEEVCIRALQSLGVRVERRRDSAAHIGLWVENKKVVSMGIRITRWVTSFGFVINYEGEHKESAYVRPCGLDGIELATLEEILGTAPARSRVIDAVKENFASVFARALRLLPEVLVHQLCSPAKSGEAHLTGSG